MVRIAYQPKFSLSWILESCLLSSFFSPPNIYNYLSVSWCHPLPEINCVQVSQFIDILVLLYLMPNSLLHILLLISVSYILSFHHLVLLPTGHLQNDRTSVLGIHIPLHFLPVLNTIPKYIFNNPWCKICYKKSVTVYSLF